MRGASPIPRTVDVFGTRVGATSLDEATSRILEWAEGGGGRYVCCADAHMVVRGAYNSDYRAIVNRADLVTPDGQPIAWWMAHRAGSPQARVAGPDLMLAVCAEAARRGTPIGLYGSTGEVLESLANDLTARFPGLPITFSYSPPFRPLTPAEDAAVAREIEESGARILFVALGCPKQERWAAGHTNIPVVSIAVGWAFAIHAGESSRAPEWMQRAGLETLYQIAIEPNRVVRYAWVVPSFLGFVAAALLRELGAGLRRRIKARRGR